MGLTLHVVRRDGTGLHLRCCVVGARHGDSEFAQGLAPAGPLWLCLRGGGDHVTRRSWAESESKAVMGEGGGHRHRCPGGRLALLVINVKGLGLGVLPQVL